MASPDAAAPDVLLAAAGGPALATAGTGDVLSGIIGAFLARGLAPLEAAALAAHVHGRAAALGPAEGLVAGDLPELVAELLSELGPEAASEQMAETAVAEGAPVRLVAPVPAEADEDAAVTMAQGRSRPAWAEIDLAAVAHNAAVLARLVAPAELCAVVKAHGYGHGGPAVARAALAGGAGRLAVALVDEGVELREHGVTAPVLLLSECDPAAAATALSYGLTPTLYSPEGIAAFSAAAAAAGRPVAVHVKVDTGMHRVGVAPEDLRAVAAAVVADPLLQLESVWTHLPVADGDTAEDRAYTEGQLDLFDRLVADLAAAGIRVPLLHAANTAGGHRLSRARATTWCAAGSASTATCPVGPWRTPSPTRPAARSCARPCRSRRGWWRCARSTRGSGPPTAGCVRCRRARSWPPSRSATPTACRARSSKAASRSSSAACAVPWPAR